VSTRYIPLNQEALLALKNWRAQTTGETWVFTNKDGKSDTPYTWPKKARRMKQQKYLKAAAKVFMKL
jgi:integrase